MSAAADRLLREADDVKALAGEHGALTHPQYAITEIVLRIVAKCLLEAEDEAKEQAAA